MLIIKIVVVIIYYYHLKILFEKQYLEFLKKVESDNYTSNNYTKEEKSFDSIRSLKLTNFRSHENLSFLLSGKPLSIVGQNAVGKTNILEAISLLSPGRGLKNSNLNDLSNTKNMNGRNSQPSDPSW